VTFATLNGQRVIAAHVHVPGFGAWVADVALDDQAASPPTGQVTLVVGDLTLTGTVLPAASGTFNQKGWYRIIAGAGRWSTILPSKGYHNDAGMKASLVINDVAREAGETIGTFTDATLQGVDFVRQAGPASRIFVEALGNGINWWVDYAGTTQVGMRATSTPAAGADYDLIEYHPDSRIAVFATETPSVLTIGAMITNPRLVAPVTIRELDISLTATSLRVSAWVDEAGQVGPFDTRILRALRALVRETFPMVDYLAPARYRVISMDNGRANLQAVNPLRGMPDTTLVRLAPGMAGETAELTPGSTVLVQFIEGDPSLPVITAYATPDDNAFRPVSWSIDAPKVLLGKLATSGSGIPVARIGDLVNVNASIPLPVIMSLLVGPEGIPVTGASVPPGTPITLLLTTPLVGTIQSGSLEVQS
jgi:hypothetical protein